MKKPHRVALALLALSAASALGARGQSPGLKGEIGIGLGAGFSLARGSSAQDLAGFGASNALSLKSRPAVYLGGSYANFFGGRLGLEFGFGYLKSPLEARSLFRRGAASAVPLSADPDPSEITAVPFFLALAARWRGERAGLTLTLGPAVVLHSVLAETEAGAFAGSPGSGTAVRALAAIVDQTWAALGAEIGAALDLRVGENTALTFDARYIYSPRKTFSWTWKAGAYAGLDDPSTTAGLDPAGARAAAAATRPLSLDPSFFQLSVGIKFFLGSF